ncbi:hypothetical protein CYMTET_32652 [Cymbomonas tetramitiformis]|uniref:Uncharacterized protein n=1 Tax=Cymbomonas tetramitiformis TaxID=36881 RepID=A0AAE0FEM2_9CHLO|nr:hypothetical protein CYMTET_32652 [Cymbomonas tetramitiformis]
MDLSQASTSLHHAASKGNLEGVQRVLKYDLPGLVNARCEKSRVTPLHRAAFVGSEEVVYELLRAGADVEARNHTKIGCTALHFGAEKGHVGVVRALLESGACPEVLRSNGLSALASAAQGGHHEVIKALLDFGANAEERTKDMRTPLHLAAEGGHAKAVQTLLEAGVDINACDSVGWNALKFATENARGPVVQLLLSYGATMAGSQKVLPSDLTSRSRARASGLHRSPVATGALYPIVGDTASPAATGAMSPRAAGAFAQPRSPREVPLGSGVLGSPRGAAQVIPYHSSPSGSPKRSPGRSTNCTLSPFGQRTVSPMPLAIGEEVSFPLQTSSPVSPDSTCVITISHCSGANAASPGYLSEQPAAKGVEDEAAAPAPASTAQGLQNEMDSMKQELSAVRNRLSDSREDWQQMQGLNINCVASAISQELSQGLLADFHKQIAVSRKRQDETGQVLSAQQALLETVLAKCPSVEEKAKDREVLCQEIADEVCNDERVIGAASAVSSSVSALWQGCGSAQSARSRSVRR